LREIDEALAIDPGFLAACALRDNILNAPGVPAIEYQPAPERPVAARASMIRDLDIDFLHDDSAWQPAPEPRRHTFAMFVLAVAIAGGAFTAGILWSRPRQAVAGRAPTEPAQYAQPVQGPAPLSPVQEASTGKTPDSPAEQKPPLIDQPATGPAIAEAPRHETRTAGVAVSEVSEDAQIRGAVERFRAAYNGRAASHRESGSSALTFDRCDVSVTDGSGTAVCPRTGQSAGDNQSEWTFALVRNGSDWSIKSIAVR
jgi:hypothetical protein